MTARPIVKVSKSQPTREGAGVHLRRAFGFHAVEEVDPFLLLDDFRADRPEDYLAGFPWHPHRGIETITYMLEGSVEHGDSIGNGGVIKAGGVQWMTAGGGIVHQEMPKPGLGGRMGGFQLWANLPAEHKMMPPRYQEFAAEDLPVAQLPEGGTARVVCGSIAGVKGPVENVVIDPGWFEINLPAHCRFSHQLPTAYTALAYVFGGQARFDEQEDPYAFDAQGEGWHDMARDCLLGDHSLVLYQREEPGSDRDGESPLVVTTTDHPVRFLLMTGKPLREPVAWHGPIVMNTQAELRQAFRELDEGSFLKRDHS
jgi:redox-sensitive bicupin YhaK (pirin superfamily)